MVEVIPAVLTNSFEEACEMLAKAEGVVDRVSIDIIDGKFAANKTIDPGVIVDIETNLNLDFQLMVVEPIKWVEKCVNAGADRVIGHVEQMGSQQEFVDKVLDSGTKVGLGLDIDTPVTQIDPALFSVLDVILVMSVPAGFGGQSFREEALDKIESLYRIRDEYKATFRIQDDGGVTFEFIDDVRIAGVDEVSIGRRIFEGNLSQNIKKYIKEAYAK